MQASSLFWASSVFPSLVTLLLLLPRVLAATPFPILVNFTSGLSPPPPRFGSPSQHLWKTRTFFNPEFHLILLTFFFFKLHSHRQLPWQTSG